MQEDNNILLLGEHFYSIQGEGNTVGKPAYFIRFSGCNLNCGGLNGIKVKTGEATWHCDSEAIWKQVNKVEYGEIFKAWNELNIFGDIMRGDVNIIFTGGEPLIAKNINQIIDFMKKFKKVAKNTHYDLFDQWNPFIEVETNGTQILPNEELIKFSQINCSPKLKNSGNNAKIRINPIALQSINSHKNSFFKIVISDKKDIEEFINEFIIPNKLDVNKIVLMPAMTSQSEFFEKTKMIFEMAKEYKLRAVPRLHIAAWDKVTGV